VTLYAVAAVLAVMAVALLGPCSTRLARAGWVVRAPRAGVAVWQALGVSALVSGIGAGLCVAVERYHDGFAGGLGRLVDGMTQGRPLAGLGLPDALGLTLAADLAIVLGFLLAAITARTAASRARHRRLVDLLSVRNEATGASVLDHPAAVAYCVPGFRPRIVVSAGAVALLEPAELTAVVAHEQGHAAERHGLVMLPMVGLRKLFGFVPYAALARFSVGRLLEMAADDYAARRTDLGALISALVSMATAGAPPVCTFGVNGAAVTERVDRLLHPSGTARRVAVAAAVACAALVVVPVGLLLAA